jgi:hypothetical protein
MEWILVICTQSWVMCGQIREAPYETEQQCYRAMDELYKRQDPSKFKWVVCENRKKKAANGIKGEA